jgi:hypothetical protein
MAIGHGPPYAVGTKQKTLGLRFKVGAALAAVRDRRPGQCPPALNIWAPDVGRAASDNLDPRSEIAS